MKEEKKEAIDIVLSLTTGRMGISPMNINDAKEFGVLMINQKLKEIYSNNCITTNNRRIFLQNVVQEIKNI